ncbi:hypothetical protein [Streptomyces tubercidicus]|uniref:hypothetical protein n=1 Tax=Streptomyces tubercidicus TaxID=47759 RepID=UPI002E187C6F|nr:hypothetical protein OG690_28775 [Streptomyces tubercidicus]
MAYSAGHLLKQLAAVLARTNSDAFVRHTPGTELTLARAKSMAPASPGEMVALCTRQASK